MAKKFCAAFLTVGAAGDSLVMGAAHFGDEAPTGGVSLMQPAGLRIEVKVHSLALGEVCTVRQASLQWTSGHVIIIPYMVIGQYMEVIKGGTSAVVHKVGVNNNRGNSCFDTNQLQNKPGPSRPCL